MGACTHKCISVAMQCTSIYMTEVKCSPVITLCTLHDTDMCVIGLLLVLSTVPYAFGIWGVSLTLQGQ